MAHEESTMSTPLSSVDPQLIEQILDRAERALLACERQQAHLERELRGNPSRLQDASRFNQLGEIAARVTRLKAEARRIALELGRDALRDAS